MYRTFSIFIAVIGVVMLTGAAGAKAGERYRYFDAGVRVGRVNIDIGYDAHQGTTLFLRTAHDFYEHPQYRCGSGCRRVKNYVHHDYRCPRLGHYLGRNGYRTLDIIPRRIAARYLDNRYDRNDNDYRYRDPYARRSHRSHDDDYGRRYRGYGDDDDDDDDYRRHRHYDGCGHEGYGCNKRGRHYDHD